jgi:hypothetical protein
VPPSATPTATIEGAGAEVTFFGVVRADGFVTDPVGTSPEGYPIYERQLPQGFFVVLEARPGPDLRSVGSTTYTPGNLPDMMMVTNRPLGNGSSAVCDDGTSGPPGGVPAVDPPVFDGSAINPINDLGCRFSSRANDGEACTRDFSASTFFVDPTSTIQFCPKVGIGSEIAFPVGDTILTARVRNVLGQAGAPASIVIRVLP